MYREVKYTVSFREKFHYTTDISAVSFADAMTVYLCE